MAKNVTTVQVANYQNGKGHHKHKKRLTIFADADWIDKHFSIGARFSCKFDGTASSGRYIYIEEDKSSSYRWGKLLKGNRRSLGIVHNDSSMPAFGAITIEADGIFDDELHRQLVINLPDDLAKPIKKTKPKGPTLAISLRDAVRAVNQRKAEMGDELILTIENGSLCATLQYT